MTDKQEILKTLEGLPEQASIEDAMERLYLLYKIRRGLAQADSGQKVTQAEARERMSRWLK